ncbi:MAG: HD domain-containing protein [Sphaerochaeta sp.]
MSLTYEQFLRDPSMASKQTIRDPLWKDITIPSFLHDVIQSPSFVKLGRIKQLGVAFHLYPGAVHTRLNHSLGVFYLAKEMIESILRRACDEGRFTLKGVHHFLAAVLLHDIGHFPFTHSLKELPLLSHEELATHLLDRDKILHDALIASDLDPTLIKIIIDESLPTDDPELLLYRSMLSGALDPDKLDYLNRDAYFAGVPYGVQDVSYITEHLLIFDGALAINASALGSVEHLLFSKYLMYRNVYWHRATRSATAMIKRYLYENLSDGKIQEEELYDLDDESFFLLGSEERPLSQLIAAVRSNQLYTPVVEEAFDKEKSLHQKAVSLTHRRALEEHIETTCGLGRGSLVIDIPEHVSFESDIPVVKDGTYLGTFERVDPLFNRSRALEFTSSLRMVRIFAESRCDHQAIQKSWESLHE